MLINIRRIFDTYNIVVNRLGSDISGKIWFVASGVYSVYILFICFIYTFKLLLIYSIYTLYILFICIIYAFYMVLLRYAYSVYIVFVFVK